VKCKTGGLQEDFPPEFEFTVFGLVTLHLWGRIFKKFPDLRGLAYADDGNIIGPLSKALKLTSELKPVFKSDGNLDFNLGKTMILATGTSARHVFDRAQFFLQSDPDLQDIAAVALTFRQRMGQHRYSARPRKGMLMSRSCFSQRAAILILRKRMGQRRSTPLPKMVMRPSRSS
jgi:hypothetical protein